MKLGLAIVKCKISLDSSGDKFILVDSKCTITFCGVNSEFFEYYQKRNFSFQSIQTSVTSSEVTLSLI